MTDEYRIKRLKVIIELAGQPDAILTTETVRCMLKDFCLIVNERSRNPDDSVKCALKAAMIDLGIDTEW